MEIPKRARSWKRRLRPRANLKNDMPVLYSTNRVAHFLDQPPAQAVAAIVNDIEPGEIAKANAMSMSNTPIIDNFAACRLGFIPRSQVLNVRGIVGR